MRDKFTCRILGKAVEKAMENIDYVDKAKIEITQKFLDLPKRQFPSVEQAETNHRKAIERLKNLRSSASSEKLIQTAECDWFGAEEILTLAKAAKSSALKKIYDNCLPAEIQVISIGKWNFVGWPGECFTDFALKVKDEFKDAFVISLANGELRGYIVTKEAFEEGGYEASNALFRYTSGNILVDKTIELLGITE